MTASLKWDSELRFTASSGSQTMTLDGRGKAGPSPVQALAVSIAGCMAMDVVDILQKGRHAIHGLDVAFEGGRADTPPHRFTSVTIVFTVHGEVPGDAVRRAIALSHEKDCSVSKSRRGDIAFATEFEVRP